MNTLPMIWSAAMAVAVAALCGIRLLFALRERRRGNIAVLRKTYRRIAVSLFASAGSPTPRFPAIETPGARMLLAETLAEAAVHASGFDCEALRRVAERYDLEHYLLRRIRLSGGYRRARLLNLLSCLPLHPETALRTARYARSRNPYVRFQTLLVRLAADPAHAEESLAAYPTAFSACQVAELMALLRRGMLQVAYRPLVTSDVRNLRTLGLAIVRQFGLETAEEELLRIAANDPAHTLGREAVYALCAMQRPLDRSEVVRCIRSMNRAGRKALLRFMAAEGYAAGALRQLFDPREQPYYESLVQSYKCTLACL